MFRLGMEGEYQVFTILRILDAENLYVSLTSPWTTTSVPYNFTRQTTGKFLRFVGHAFTPQNPAPKRLWAEVSYLDNNDAVEDNFGVLVGVTRDQLKQQGANLNYKSAVSGLMYALATGPQLANLQLAAQILLGQPFTQSPGTITEIDDVYKRDDNGVPTHGRILISATGTDGKSTGITNIYLFPLGRQLVQPDGSYLPSSPDFSGLGTNPKTGLPFAVGDQVDQFTSLSKGVAVEEYQTTPTWFRNLPPRETWELHCRSTIHSV